VHHGAGQAHGLSFSVQHGTPIPPSLRNIYSELHSDLDIPLPSHGNLEAWAKQGVLLLNSTLTVREGEAGSHAGYGWETFTDAIISYLGSRQQHIVFMLWGGHAGKKTSLIGQHHTVITSVHPSPLSAHRGFFGSRPFSQANRALSNRNQPEINWMIA
jgi:uracil-DNA glycosylase